MMMFAGLDAGGQRTAVSMTGESGRVIWEGVVDTHLAMTDAALQRFKGSLSKAGLETGSFTPLSV